LIDPETAGKFADATKAVADTSGKAIDATTGFARICKGPVAELIGCVEDKFKYTRWERRIALIEKAEARMRDRGLAAPTRELPLPFAVPLLTAAVLEEDDELQEIWARLLVNAGDGSTDMELRVAYVEILRGMTAFDVLVLSKLAETALNWKSKTRRAIDVKQIFEVDPEDTDELPRHLAISLGNLARLGCAFPGGGWDAAVIFRYMTVTGLGIALYNACT
jgi:hypothetical protein